MVTGFSLAGLENGTHDSSSLDIQSFCQLQSQQLTSQYPIFFARIVYHNSLRNAHEEVRNYALQEHFSPKTLAYLRSEEWLTDYPPAFTLSEVKLKDFQSISYICPIGYKNQKPEYIQIIAHQPLDSNLQESVKLSAMLLSKYTDIFLENSRQKSEIKLLEEILHRVGHQLRNSLALIGLQAHNLYLRLQDNPWQEQAIIVRDSIQDLDTNLTQLLDCGQGAKLRITLQDLRSVVAESIKCLQPCLDQKQVKILIPDTSTTLAIDRLQMKQVFDNILSNAVHFSPDLGTITCSWQIFQGEVLIKISDQGPGLSQEELKKIFTPFYSRRSGGTGLGLTIAKKIVLDHHGNLWAQSVSGGGAQFSLILPRPTNI
ncbi:MAG: HAMP domain-containing histidine kinase [Scytonema hyalinum WJT4-NPBG1]|jgi:signal transduction histidine kinase|nr:HAMP domain-containing histidine kinase [Scytonema hyalinum WJT4-NPBG1]